MLPPDAPIRIVADVFALFGQARLVQKAGAAGRGLYGDTAGLHSLTQPQLQQIHISGRQGVHVPTLEEFLRCCPADSFDHCC